MTVANPLGLAGIGFLEFASPTPAKLATLWRDFGFSRTHEHRNYSIEVWRQNAITLLVNEQRGSFAEQFAQQHGPSIPSMGWLCEDAERASRVAVRHGARPYEYETPFAAPAVYGVGNSLIHFIEAARWQENFTQLRQPEIVLQKGLHSIDHLTINVLHDTLATWVDFHKQVFGFTEVHAPHSHGNHKAPQPHALRSPDGSFCIAINESSEENTQIEEYLHAYKGAGIRHLAFRTNDLLKILDALRGTSITTLAIDDAYYADAFKRVLKTREEQQRIKAHGVLVDGDVTGNLLQVFTPPLIGPIFIELIEHEDHPAFGSGNSWNVVTLEGA
jgi:4-hydroxyphenylpyruvate dioxygenase